MYLSVSQVIPLDNNNLLLTFANGETRLFDVSPLMHLGVFSELRNSEIFNSVRVSFDTVAWSNGADIDPERLYSDSLPIK